MHCCNSRRPPFPLQQYPTRHQAPHVVFVALVLPPHIGLFQPYSSHGGIDAPNGQKEEVSEGHKAVEVRWSFKV